MHTRLNSTPLSLVRGRALLGYIWVVRRVVLRRWIGGGRDGSGIRERVNRSDGKAHYLNRLSETGLDRACT
jgi:hypothetical protein